jgi:hypothetical protein
VGSNRPLAYSAETLEVTLNINNLAVTPYPVAYRKKPSETYKSHTKFVRRKFTMWLTKEKASHCNRRLANSKKAKRH